MKQKAVKKKTNKPVRINIYLWESDLKALDELVEIHTAKQVPVIVNRSMMVRMLIHEKYLSFGLLEKK